MDDLVGPFLRLIAAVIAGGLIGLNRDIYGKPTVHFVTAASIWMTASLGVACGVGAWKLAALATAAALVVLGLGTRIDRALFRRFGPKNRDGDAGW